MGPESKTVIPIRGCLDSVRISVEKGDELATLARIGKFSGKDAVRPVATDRANRNDGGGRTPAIGRDEVIELPLGLVAATVKTS